MDQKESRVYFGERRYYFDATCGNDAWCLQESSEPGSGKVRFAIALRLSCKNTPALLLVIYQASITPGDDMKRTITIGVVLTVTLAFFYVEPALAGPGGKIARAAFETFWGRVALGFLTILFLPLIMYVIIREKPSSCDAKTGARLSPTVPVRSRLPTSRESAR
jgi:hypothetical protein